MSPPNLRKYEVFPTYLANLASSSMLKLCFMAHANTSILHVYLKLAFLRSALRFKVTDELAVKCFASSEIRQLKLQPPCVS